MRFWTSSGDGRRPFVQRWMTRSARSTSSSRSRRRCTRPRRAGSPSSRSMIWLPMLSARSFSRTLRLRSIACVSSFFHAGSLILPLALRRGALPPPVLAFSFRALSTSWSRSRSRRSTPPKALTTVRVSSISFSSVNSSSLTSTTSLMEMSPLRSSSRSSRNRSRARLVLRMATVTWFLPSSMRLARAISPSRVSRATRPISRR